MCGLIFCEVKITVAEQNPDGTGLKRIDDACELTGVKVEFKMLKLGFAVVFYRPETSISDGNIGDSIGENIGVNETQRTRCTGFKLH